jgi:hypothetical protein
MASHAPPLMMHVAELQEGGVRTPYRAIVRSTHRLVRTSCPEVTSLCCDLQGAAPRCRRQSIAGFLAIILGCLFALAPVT